jgi:hypothetical protein
VPTSEITYAAGVDFAGNIAPEIQFVQTFSAAIVAGSREIEGSKRLIEFLTSARCRGNQERRHGAARCLAVGFPGTMHPVGG